MCRKLVEGAGGADELAKSTGAVATNVKVAGAPTEETGMKVDAEAGADKPAAAAPKKPAAKDDKKKAADAKADK